jgi:hypothetical protein
MGRQKVTFVVIISRWTSQSSGRVAAPSGVPHSSPKVRTWVRTLLRPAAVFSLTWSQSVNGSTRDSGGAATGQSTPADPMQSP